MASCRKCGSRFLNYSRLRTFSERIDLFRGIRMLRCHDCHARFQARTIDFSELPYARCPKCYRLDLSTWSEKYFHPTAWMRMRLILGGKRFRCEYCRLNFVSYRGRKEKFSFHRFDRKQETEKGSK